MIVRDSRPADVAAVTAIYCHHVLGGVASFEEDPPGEAEIARRREAVLAAGLPYLVAERDARVVGYAYAALYRPRSAYRHTVENSVYVSPDYQRRGAGRALLAALIERCRAAGKREMVAVIGDPANAASVALHRGLGFRDVGTLARVGLKHGRWLDTLLMQLSLREAEGEGAAAAPRRLHDPERHR